MLPGFKQYIVRQVPFGKIKPSDNISNFPIIHSGIWISECGRFNIFEHDNDIYCLHIIRDHELFGGYRKFCGTQEKISTIYHELCKMANKNKQRDSIFPFNID